MRGVTWRSETASHIPAVEEADAGENDLDLASQVSLATSNGVKCRKIVIWREFNVLACSAGLGEQNEGKKGGERLGLGRGLGRREEVRGDGGESGSEEVVFFGCFSP